MKQFITFCCGIFCTWSSLQCEAETTRSGQELRWHTNYDEALGSAKSSSKPLLLFFTGSDWCGWCNKLEDEVLNSSDFIQEAGTKFVFLKLDFPLYKSLSPALTSQNKSLKQKFNIKSYPTIVILDTTTMQKVGVTGYRPGGGKQYAAYLLKMVGDYHSYRQSIKEIDHQKYSGQQLAWLYQKAKELKQDNDANRVVHQGMKSDKRSFFLKERYRYLAVTGQIHEEEAQAIKKQLIAEDPRNEHKTHYEIAVMEFEAFSEEVQATGGSPELAVSPLVDYIERFGREDKENLWRLQMIISQVYLDQNQLWQALKYAQSSYQSAPSSVRAEISTAVKNIKSQVH